MEGQKIRLTDWAVCTGAPLRLSLPGQDTQAVELWYCRTGRMACALSSHAVACLGEGQALLRRPRIYPGALSPIPRETCAGLALTFSLPPDSPLAAHPLLDRPGWAVLAPSPAWALPLDQAAVQLSLGRAARLELEGALPGLLERGAHLLPVRCCTPAQFQLACQLCQYLLEQIHCHVTIGQLAQRFHASPTQIKLSFRLVYGDSLYAYTRAEKMRRAAVQLRSTQRSVLDIAGDYGYDNAGKFAAAFRQVMGLSPSAYRRACAH